jgi:hypothetical protein
LNDGLATKAIVKDQYFGDVNDYRKYGILRALIEGSQLRVGVCWLRTVNDHRRDGEFRQYLQQPERWRHYDSELYDALRRLLDPGVARTVLHAESWGLLPGARYHHRFLNDDASDRRSYFAEAWERLSEAQVLFVDPDNGLQIQSVGYGKRKSAKYLYWHEVKEAYERGHSLIIYQHFGRQRRDLFVKGVAGELSSRLAGSRVEAFLTANTVFFAAVRPEHLGMFQKATDLVRHRWKSEIRCAAHAMVDRADQSD